MKLIDMFQNIKLSIRLCILITLIRNFDGGEDLKKGGQASSWCFKSC